MEWAFLGHTIIYLHQCRCQKFYAGKQKPDVIFLFHLLPRSFYFSQITFQFITHPAYDGP